ncbi:deubiquitinase OTUD6B-like, partial [Stegodyphus dumicola]|uniref:deubiquitinase OTUD6B-like n=1 Tax=Stegodyphus dumicola TaxID=202533 RepID=UPI0015AB6F15
GKNVSELATSNGSDAMGETSVDCSEVQDVRTTDGSQLPGFYASENKSQISEGSQKLSKAQKRRNKKSIMEKERIKAIIEQEEKNLSGSRHIESEKIRKKLSDRNLVIHEIPSDGNCLYKAIEHQLSTLNLQ